MHGDIVHLYVLLTVLKNCLLCSEFLFIIPFTGVMILFSCSKPFFFKIFFVFLSFEILFFLPKDTSTVSLKSLYMSLTINFVSHHGNISV